MYFSSIARLIVSVLISLLGILINIKYLKDMRDEDRNRGPNSNGLLTKRVMTTYTITLMIFVPASLILHCVLTEEFELPRWFLHSLCYQAYIWQGIRIYLAFNSLVVAAMRYLFVVHDNDILQFGMEKAKRLFYYGSIAIPIMIEIILACTVPMSITPMSNLETAVICTSSYQKPNSRTYLNSTPTHDFDLPIHSFVNQYISSDILYYLRGFVFVLLVIVFGNVAEGILYWKTFAKIQR